MPFAPGRPGKPGRPGAVRSWRRGPVCLLLAIASLLVVDATQVDRLRTQIAADVAADSGAGPRLTVVRAPVRHAAPIAVSIDRLGISSSLIDLRKNPNGTVQVPSDVHRVGWYVGSAHPGDAGPTVLIGHVDSYKGPAVFHRLRELHKGDLVRVARADKTQAVFVVTEVRRVAKRHFPTALVYVGDGKASLRLVTCGGVFDRQSGHYLDNTVVLATSYVPPPRVSRNAEPAPLHPRRPR